LVSAAPLPYDNTWRARLHNTKPWIRRSPMDENLKPDSKGIKKVIFCCGHASQVELQAPVQPLESADTANFHKHDEMQSVHRIDHDFKARVEELCAVGVKPKQIMQQLLEDGTWGTLDDRVEQQVIGIRKRFFTSRTPLGRKNTYADLLQWFKQIEVRHTHTMYSALPPCIWFAPLSTHVSTLTAPRVPL
jgi:hypothetical protein